MFGHQDDRHDEGPQHDETTTEIAPDQPDAATAAASDDDQATTHDDTHGNDEGASEDNGGSEVPDQPEATATEDDDWQHPGEPIDDNPEQIADIIAPIGGHTQSPTSPMPINARDLPDDDGKTPHELIDIKQKALNELTPLMGQLELAPEDKFRTLLMIIQASDDQGMIKQAYEAAEAIKDEKVRAQALLDLVNEINYFTQHPTDQG